MIKKIFIRLILLLFITIFILVVIEVILRTIFPDEVRNPFDSYIFAFKFNDDYLADLVPNSSFKNIKTVDTNNDSIEINRWKTNSASFRGNELISNPDARVVVYGDSNIQAISSKLEHTYPFLLGQMLRSKLNTNIEVINAGVVGFGPDQSLLKIKNQSEFLKPDLIIFHIFADNDYGDIIRNRLFTLNFEGKLVETGFRNVLDQELSYTRKINAILSSLLFARKAKEIGLAIDGKNTNDDSIDLDLRRKYLVHWLKDRNEDEYEIYENGLPRKFSQFDDHYDIDIALNPKLQSSQTKIALMREIISEAKKYSDESGIKIIFLIQPSIIDMTMNNFILNFDYLSQESDDYNNDNLIAPLDQICKRYKLNCINLYKIFKVNNPEKLYFNDYTDDHWNNQGQYVAAKSTAEYIINNKILHLPNR